ncbi:MAG: helix-turn-helix domain-containing protein [Magnetospirillum sp.]
MRAEPKKRDSEGALPSGSTIKVHRSRRLRSATRDGPDAIDVHVGARIRLRRTLLGLSQGELGKALGLTFQQVQKYERGANRVAASTLYRVANTLDVPVSFFFDDLPDGPGHSLSGNSDDALSRRESLELLRGYYTLPDSIRKQVYDLVKSLRRMHGDG